MSKLVNKYEIKDDYVIGYTNRYNNEFYFDLEDFDKVKEYYWRLDSSGNVICDNEQPQLSMHKLIMGDGIYIHKNDKKYDNRKRNLISARGYHNDGKVYSNGYITVYMPEHERAFDNGCVYEHIIVAEKMLGRKLNKGECVHHKDMTKTNNSPDNLIVFKTNEDHIAFHGGADIYLDGDVWVAKSKKKLIINKKVICPICNKNKKTYSANMCVECLNKQKASNIPSKEEIEPLIYKMSFTQIGNMYGVSDNAVRKWCKKYSLPYRKTDIKNLTNKVI